MKHFDHIILGTGQATGTLLADLLQRNQSIALIEASKVGGTCVNWGCTPTKALVASARVAYTVQQRAAEHGVEAADVRVNFPAAMSRMNKVRGDANSGMVKWIENEPNATLFRGLGSFVGPKSIKVGDEVVSGDEIYINVGARPITPSIPGLDAVDFLDNAALLDLDELPEHLIIIGGSYIGLEFAQAFRRFGSSVTVIERGSHLMSREDSDVAEAVRGILVKEGIEIHLGSSATFVESSASGVEVTIESEHGRRRIAGSHLLVATGRKPNSDRIGADAVGLELDDRGYIVVDDHCRTNVEGVYAVGDVNGKGAFTHTSVNDAEIVLDLSRGGRRKVSDRIPVYALFIDPALGRVGMTEKEALATGRRILKATRSMARINRAKEMGETQGFAKLLVDAETDLILGASILGPGGDEIINMFAAYMYSGLPCRDYRRSVLVHPTISELMPWILDALEPIH